MPKARKEVFHPCVIETMHIIIFLLVVTTGGRLQPVLMRPTPQLSVKTRGGGGGGGGGSWGGVQPGVGGGGVKPGVRGGGGWPGVRGESSQG